MPTTALQSLIDQITASQKKSVAANEQRYKDLLASIDTLSKQIGKEGTFGEAEALLGRIGEAARADITTQAARAKATSEQDLISRGLGQTTIRESAKRGISADEAKALQAQSESEAAQKAGLLTQRAGSELALGQLKAGAIQGREDVGPDLATFASLIQAAAEADKASQKTTVRVPSTAPAGALTRWQAQQAAGGGGGGGGISQSSGGAGGGGALPRGSVVYGAASSPTPPQTATPALTGRGASPGQPGAPVPAGAVTMTPAAGAAAPSATPESPSPADKISGAPGTEAVVGLAKEMANTETYEEYRKRVGPQNAASEWYWEIILKGR